MVRSGWITDIVSPPSTMNGRAVLSYTALLSGLLVIGVPIIAVTVNLPVLGLVAAAGICYLFVIMFTERMIEGICGAIFTLITFAANVPLYRISVDEGRVGIVLNVMLVDVVLLPLVVLIAIWQIRENASIDGSFISRVQSGRIAGYALIGIVIWSALSVIVGNGPSRLAAAFFVVVQLRYLLLFVVAAQIVRYVGLRNSVYSILIAVSFQLFFAVVQVINGVWFGLSYLGEASGGRHGYFFIGPIKFVEAIYPGGFTGTSRVFVAVLLLFLPIFVEIVIRRRLLWKIGAFICLLCSALITRVSQTDAGLGAFSLVTLFTTGTLTYFIISDEYRRYLSSTYEATVGVISSVGAGVINVVLFLGRSVPVTTTPSREAPSKGGYVGGSTSTGSSRISQEILSTLDALPLISSNTLSVRLHQYFLAIDFGLRYPLFGLGGFNFAVISLSLGFSHALEIHNIYLSFLAEIGIPGALLLITAMVTVFYCAVLNTRTDEDRTIWAMIACGLIGFYAYNFWVAIQSGVAFMTFWTLAGVTVGASQPKVE